MTLRFRTLILFIINIFLGISTVDCFIKQKEYIIYFNEVTNYISDQLKKINLEYVLVSISKDKIISIKEALKYKTENKNELLIKYNIIVDLLNYLFSKELQNFTEHLKIISDDCDIFFKENSFKNATYCTVGLLNAAKNSNLMFEYLYKAIIFIDYLDVKLVLRNSIHPKTIVEEIYTVKNYTFLMKTPEIYNYVNNAGNIKIEVLLKDYIEINNFVNKIAAITDSFNNNNVTIINSRKEFNLRVKYYGEYINNNYIMNFADFVREKLYLYCSETIYDFYEKIGFNQLLYPNIPELMPPQNTNQNEAIKALNTLFRKGDWKLLNHIRITIDDEIITTNQITRDTVDDFNFNMKRKYFTQLIRCRYTEILKKYNIYMSAVIQICKYEKSNKEFNNFVNCILQFFEMVNDSKEMFKHMLLALDKLQASYIWEVMYNSYACLTQTYNLLSKFFSEIENLNFRKNDFINLSIDEQERMVTKFLINFQSARKDFTLKIKDGLNSVNECCLIDGEILNKKQLISSWESIVSSTNNNNTLDHPLFLYEYGLEDFMTFFNIAIRSEYNCLGFDNITINN
ncbi:uncharacterized protein LOC126910460 isoform X1 [Daktulosphaira vitifoliae]|uniref:uncharacterized protein LOC126910460 isoform X1 n=1 Tax=Daktulosphaira vitifoliae TaxID=58002 RepID=UPI0021A9E10D|nr:uncharacterized protein LOC126910460 isoform X1 [Daktulosphaira vitifoliae]